MLKSHSVHPNTLKISLWTIIFLVLNGFWANGKALYFKSRCLAYAIWILIKK